MGGDDEDYHLQHGCADNENGDKDSDRDGTGENDSIDYDHDKNDGNDNNDHDKNDGNDNGNDDGGESDNEENDKEVTGEEFKDEENQKADVEGGLQSDEDTVGKDIHHDDCENDDRIPGDNNNVETYQNFCRDAKEIRKSILLPRGFPSIYCFSFSPPSPSSSL